MRRALDEIEALYRTRLPAFVRVARAIVGDEELARDAVHEGFVRAVRYRDRLREVTLVEPWVWRIVLNEARKRRQQPVHEVPLSREERAETWNGAADPVRALVAALPERQRLVLFLRYYADLDYGSIAETIGVKPGTVAATLHAAHAALREKLEEVQT